MGIDVLQIGYKGIGRGWCQTIKSAPGCRLVGVVDPDDEARQMAESETGVGAFSSVAEAKASVDAGAAVIASPSFAHAENVRDCLDSGLHVLVEKPFTLDLGEAKRLVGDADGRGLQLLVSQNYRYHAESCAARDFLSAGKVGSVEFVQIRGFNLADMDGTNYRCGIDNPHLWEMAIHQFDLLRFLFERDVERVFCTLLNPSWSWYKGNALTHAWLELEGGVKVDYVGTYVTQGPQSTWENSWRFEGTGGTLLWHDSADGPLQYVSGPGEAPEAVLAGPLPHENLQGTLNELLKAIDRGAAAYCSGRDNLKSLAICSACEISARERQVVEVAEAPNC